MLEKNKNDIWSKTRNKKPKMPTRTSGVLFENKSRISEVKDVECAEAAQTDDPPETLSAFSHGCWCHSSRFRWVCFCSLCLLRPGLQRTARQKGWRETITQHFITTRSRRENSFTAVRMMATLIMNLLEIIFKKKPHKWLPTLVCRITEKCKNSMFSKRVDIPK